MQRQLPFCESAIPQATHPPVLAMLAVWYEIRRRKRQAVLCPLRGRIGCYRGNRFQYSFLPEEMVRVRTDFSTAS